MPEPIWAIRPVTAMAIGELDLSPWLGERAILTLGEGCANGSGSGGGVEGFRVGCMSALICS